MTEPQGRARWRKTGKEAACKQPFSHPGARLQRQSKGKSPPRVRSRSARVGTRPSARTCLNRCPKGFASTRTRLKLASPT